MTSNAWNNASASLAVDPTGSTTLFSLSFPSVTLKNSQLYIEGGHLRLSPLGNASAYATIDRASYVETHNPCLLYAAADGFVDTRLLWLELTTAFSWSSYHVSSLSKPSGIPSQQQAVTFTGNNDPRIFVFGGSIANPNASSPEYIAPPIENDRQFWYFDSVSLDWTLATINRSSGVQNVVIGAATSDPNRDVGYYLDGEIDSGVVLDSPTVVVTGLVSFNFSDLSWKNETIPGQSTIGGFIEYVPVGKEGILVVFGGQDSNAGSDGSSAVFNDLSLIQVYDIDSGSWYNQTATGANGQEFPESRTSGCSAMAVSPDNSTYNIYVQGGQTPNGEGVDLLGDIWILSLPSFTWINVTSENQVTQWGQTCEAVGKHMFSVGGAVGAYVQPLFFIFDMVGLSWINSYDPNAEPYGIPQAVTSVIGGNSTGGTSKSPISGWTSPQLADIFSTTPTILSTTTTTPTPALKKQPTSTNKTGIIAGATVGSVIFLICACLVLLYIYRKRMKRLERERLERERLERERVEAERVEAKRVEAERVEAERVEAERKRVEAERERLEAPKENVESKPNHYEGGFLNYRGMT